MRIARARMLLILLYFFFYYGGILERWSVSQVGQDEGASRSGFRLAGSLLTAPRFAVFGSGCTFPVQCSEDGCDPVLVGAAEAVDWG